MASVQHPNVIAYKQAFIDEPSSNLCLVMEYANSGDLSQRVKNMRSKDQMFQEEVILKILTQMCLGILALHSLRIMHRDLKVSYFYPSKVLLLVCQYILNRRQHSQSWRPQRLKTCTLRWTQLYLSWYPLLCITRSVER